MFGEIEKELVVRRKVSLTPSAPRFARVGDVFEAGAVLTVSGSTKKKPKVTVTLELEGESGERLTILGSSKQVIKVGRDGTEEVRFQVEATKVGAAAFKISAGEGWRCSKFCWILDLWFAVVSTQRSLLAMEMQAE